MQTQFVLIILSLSFIKGTCSGQSISEKAALKKAAMQQALPVRKLLPLKERAYLFYPPPGVPSEFREQIIKYLTEIAKRSRKKNPSTQKEK
mgnify:CR=1 FL=1